MPRIVLAPDSFKGCLTAPAVSAALASGLRRVWPTADILERPMADGGEGTLEAILTATGGTRHTAQVSAADGRLSPTDYGLIHDDSTISAVLESAKVVGFAQAGDTPVAQRHSMGLGELLRHVLDRGVRRFFIGLGGSSTNDGGAGLLAALGVRLLDVAGQGLPPTPEGLAGLHRLDFSALEPRLRDCQLILLSDVDNPLCGADGATAVFGPQKGVTPDQVTAFDARLRHLADLGDAWAGDAYSLRPGAGAAGGLGYALLLVGAEMRSGAETIAQINGLDAALAGADWAITGEGRSDLQTLRGKAPQVVAAHARRAGVPVSLVSGAIDPAALAALSTDFDDCHAISSGPDSIAAAIAQAPERLAAQAERLARHFRSGNG